MAISFHLHHRDGAARTGLLVTPHGAVETPIFMPVGTQATVKGLTPDQLAAVGTQILLGNTYHLTLRPGDADPALARGAVRRTLLWAERCKAHHTRADQAQFAIVQGGTDLRLREECARELVAMDFPGYALGGFSVGESPAAMHAALPECAALLPEGKPRYLMGVGRPEDLLVGVAAGIDLFDCVMPTRSGRNALAFTRF